jgi:uroporphyrinogen decarboxylase
VEAAEDWLSLPVLDPQQGHLAEAKRSVRLVRTALGEDVPVLMTIFSPLSQAKNLAGSSLLRHIRQHPDQVMAGLETITESVLRFVADLKGIGIDGIFYAAQLAEANRLSSAEYQRFGRPYDLRILQATSDLWFNMLHVHGLHTYFDLFTDYPVQAVNWHDRETGPSLAEAAQLFPGALSGGLNRWTMQQGTPEAVHQEAVDAIAQTAGRRLILSTGCVTMTNTPLGNLRAARQAVEGEAPAPTNVLS